MNLNLMRAISRFVRRANDPKHVRPVEHLPDDREQLNGMHSAVPTEQIKVK